MRATNEKNGCLEERIPIIVLFSTLILTYLANNKTSQACFYSLISRFSPIGFFTPLYINL